MSYSVVDDSRLSLLNSHKRKEGKCVIYWMQKDQRSKDNWAILRAAEIANEARIPLVVVFVISDKMQNAYVRHYEFMLRGLTDVAKDLASRNIGFILRQGTPWKVITELSLELEAIAVITDQSYLALGKARRQKAALSLNVPLEAVDAAMIVPPEVLSDKQLYAAYIARPKLFDQFDRYLTNFPDLMVDVPWTKDTLSLDPGDIKGTLELLHLDPSSGPVRLNSGMSAASKALEKFVSHGVGAYKDTSGDPVASSTSQLSAYLHYGQISAQRVAWELKHCALYAADRESIDKYLDELITWRELSTNFVKYNASYASLNGAPEWAQKSLALHQEDERDYLYTREEFENALTHDDLWNAAQHEMVKSGRMHGYLRMYWAKKILEWSPSAVEAVATSIYLNDKYELDGRDPNGYAGILWAIAGLHDRPWFERDVYGQIRYMNYNGAKKKFDVTAYILWTATL
jgi:deoxyribodipyrimidine photo-lyase